MYQLICECGHENELHDGLGFCMVKYSDEEDNCECLNKNLATEKGKIFWMHFYDSDERIRWIHSK